MTFNKKFLVATALAWALEAVIFASLAIRYNNKYLDISAAITLFLSFAQLNLQLYLGEINQNLSIHPHLAPWIFVFLCFAAIHTIYRFSKEKWTNAVETTYLVSTVIVASIIIPLFLDTKAIAFAWAIYGLVLMSIGILRNIKHLDISPLHSLEFCW